MRRRHIIGAQDWQQAQRLVDVDAVNILAAAPRLGQIFLELLQLVLARQGDDAARTHQRRFAEDIGRVGQHRLAGDGQRADHAVAVIDGEERRRPPGRVIGGPLLALDHHHAAVPAEFEGRAGSGDAAADNQEIAVHEEFCHVGGDRETRSRLRGSDCGGREPNPTRNVRHLSPRVNRDQPKKLAPVV